MQISKPHDLDKIFVKITKPITNVDWFEYVDAVPEWGKRLETTLSSGTTEVTYRARSPFNSQFDICRVIINVVELSPPVLTFCPESFTVYLNQFETSRSIFWKEPTFESTQPLKQIFKSVQIGTKLPIGVHQIVYLASTYDGLSAKCSFKVIIKGEY